jgi:ribonuclease HI
MDFENTVIVYTDGACSGNPGKGGYGAIVAQPNGRVKELGAGHFKTTNNKMEMLAVIKALEYLQGQEEEIAVFTDSTYVIRGITQWIWGWKKKGWKTAEGKMVNNINLWKKLDELVYHSFEPKQISWHYVRGHTGNPGNERCDEIAVAFSKGKSVSLYSGSLLQYPIAVHDIPEDSSLPEMKPRKEKKIAHSYLSYVNGKLERHSTWKECEAKVKGRPGAKFKKAMSARDEVHVVEAWGLNESDLQKID